MKRKIYYYLQIVPIAKIIRNWYEIFLLLVFKNSERVLLLRNGAKFIVRHHLDALTIKEIYADDEYKISRKKPNTIIDIGANIGTFSILASLRYPSSKIYAFEPDPNTLKLLRANLALNSATNVTVSSTAISKKNGRVSFFSNPASGLSSLKNTRTGTTQTLVNAQKLEDVFIKNKIKICDFLKIDCEGAEFEILLGLKEKTLKKIRFIALEYHESHTPHSSAGLASFLRAKGFRVHKSPHEFEDDIGIMYAQR